MKYNRPPDMKVVVRLVNSLYSDYDDIKVTWHSWQAVRKGWGKLMKWPL